MLLQAVSLAAESASAAVEGDRASMTPSQVVVLVALAAGIPPIVLRLTRRWGGPWLAKHVSGIALLGIVTQGMIIVTGGAVRLTGSGLGCSSWPECEPGSFTPVEIEANSFHPYVEFGNRLLTFVLLVVAVLLAIAVWHGRPRWRWWGLVPYAGTMVQALVGGITVLKDLSPLIVALHMWLSVALVWFSTWLWLRVRGSHARDDGPTLAWPRWTSLGLFAVIIVMGTLTTGSGPHSGDPDVTERLDLNPETITRFHALPTWAFVAVVAWIAWVLFRRRALAAEIPARRAVTFLVIATLAQGAIGYTQYNLGLPTLIVGLHLAGIAALTAAHAGTFILAGRR